MENLYKAKRRRQLGPIQGFRSFKGLFMSAYTSLYISRSKARAILMEHIYKLSDEQLEAFVDTLVEPALYRVHIESDSEGRDDTLVSSALP